MNAQPTRRKYVDRAGLMEMVDKIVAKHGGGAAVARRMGVSQPAISQALRDARSRNDGLRARILLEMEGIEAVEAWEIRKGTKDEPSAESEQ